MRSSSGKAAPAGGLAGNFGLAIPAEPKNISRTGFLACALLLGALTALRLIGLQLSSVDLYFDESQYWTWSRELAFGYYSKPPLLAWVIAMAETFCGSNEACIRSPSPLFHFATALLIYAVAERIYGEQAGFFSALAYALAPGIVFSTRIISTDVPLLFFWALALLAFFELRRGGRFYWAIVLGLAIGFGLLAKYAMIYFVMCAAAAMVIDRESRNLLRTPAPWIALAIAAALVAPNIVWNLEHQFSTFRHTGDNIRGSGFRFNPLRGLEFLGTQFAVFGPVAFAALSGAVLHAFRAKSPGEDQLLLAFVLPVLLLVTATAFISRAHPNWAAAAYVGGPVVVAAWLLRLGAKKWLAAGLAFGIVVQVALVAADAMASRVNIPLLTNGDVYRQTLGWRELGEKTARLAFRLDVANVAAEHRRDVVSLSYYLRHEPIGVFAWPKGPVPADHFELTRPLPSRGVEPVLFITDCPTRARLDAHFETVVTIGRIVDATGPNTVRTHYAFLLSDARGPAAPLAACGPGAGN